MNSAKCKDIIVKNSTAVGCKFAGFVAPGHECGDGKNKNFFGNVARSINGHGARIYPDPLVASHATCYQGSKFGSAWVTQNGVVTADRSAEFRLEDVQCIDS